MKKVMVIGCPGGGKSTFSRKLHEKTGLPLYHLDMIYWNEDKTTLPKPLFIEKVKKVLALDSWIIDGNYGSTLELRLNMCDTVFFLDYPLEVCLDGIRSRMGKKRSDMPWIETEEDEEFMEFVKNFSTEEVPVIHELLNKYPENNVYIFKSRDEADKYLSYIR